jgi:O-antigen/teichoic acid export membrane protein
MNYKKISVNIISAGAQVVIIGIVYFFLYKFLLKELGPEVLGVWSVVLATSSMANLASFGVGSSVVRFVALYSEDDISIRSLVFTASMFLLLLFAGISLIVFPFATLLLEHVVGAKYLDMALMILPYSITCLIINEVAGVYASVLDGLQKNYIRSLIFSSSTVILYLLSHLLTPAMGIKGVAIAQVAQCVYTFLCCLLLLVLIKGYNPFKFNWNKEIFRQIFAYGMKFQFLSITGMLCDPVTKTLLAKFGGLDLTGYYEMASRLVNQVKGVIVNANQSLVPVLVDMSKKKDTNASGFYRATMLVVFYIALFSFAIVVIFTDLVSVVWLGRDEAFFGFCLVGLCLSSFVNLLCNPAYFSSVAHGHLNILIYSQLLMAAGNVVFGLFGGYFFGGHGVVLGWILAGLSGSIYLILIYQQREQIKLASVFSSSMAYFFLLILGIITLYLYGSQYYHNIWTQLGCFVLVCIFCFARMYTIFKKRQTYFNLT